MPLDLLTTHLDADADGLGGLLALHLLHPHAWVALPGGLDPIAREVWADQEAVLPVLRSRDDVEAALTAGGGGVLRVADAGRPDRLGWIGDQIDRFAEVCCFDTHPETDDDLPHATLPPAGAATSALVLQLAEKGIAPTAPQAGVMLVGIHVDTGHFTFPNATAVDHRAAAQCLDWGADPTWPERYAPRGFTRHQLALLERMAVGVRLLEAGGVTVALSELETARFEMDLAGLVSQLREAEGWPALVVVTAGGGKVQVIGRSDGRVDMAEVCGTLGGGGHREAAAATLRGLALEEARAAVVTALREATESARTVRDLLIRDYVSVAEHATVREAADALHEHRINALPLTQGQGESLRVVGQVGRQEVEAALRHGLDDAPAQSISARRPGQIHADASLADAQRRFAVHGGRLMMVTTGEGPPIGLVTRTGLLRELAAEVAPSRRKRPPKPSILKGLLRKHLGAGWNRAEQAGVIGAELGMDVHLVGGGVRDVLLERDVLDVDLVVSGSAEDLARALARRFGGRAVAHASFGTAKWVTEDGVDLDLARARAEHYRARATLPVVVDAALERDLGRRDFTINAMAVALHPERLGDVLDPHGGYHDLKQGRLRVLHGLSFHDDPTRMFRAARFCARFGFQLTEDTAGLLRSAVRSGALDLLGTERLGQELDRILREPTADRALALLDQWRLLSPLHPKARLDNAALEQVRMVRAEAIRHGGARGEAPDVAAALWVVLGGAVPADARAPRLVPGPRARKEAFTRDPERVHWAAKALRRARRRSQEAQALRSLSPAALAALAGAHAACRDAVAWWVQEGSALRTVVDGHQVLQAGVPRGPLLGKALEAAQLAAWDGAPAEEQLAAAVAAVTD